MKSTKFDRAYYAVEKALDRLASGECCWGVVALKLDFLDCAADPHNAEQVETARALRVTAEQTNDEVRAR